MQMQDLNLVQWEGCPERQWRHLWRWGRFDGTGHQICTGKGFCKGADVIIYVFYIKIHSGRSK
jgi:hypothetical protein